MYDESRIFDEMMGLKNGLIQRWESSLGLHQLKRAAVSAVRSFASQGGVS